jgi:hypothetical protein
MSTVKVVRFETFELEMGDGFAGASSGAAAAVFNDSPEQ